MSIPINAPNWRYAVRADGRREEVVRRQMVRLVFLLFWLLVFQGALRKWGVPQLEQALFFIRVPVTCVLYWLAIQYRAWPRATTPVLGFYCLAVVSTALLPIQFMIGGYNRAYMLIAAYGWINYFFYIPLAFIIAERFQASDMHRLMRQAVWFAVAAAPVVVLQFFSPPSSVINSGSALDEANQFRTLAAALGHIRPSGFFTSTAGQKQFVASAAAIVLAAFLMPAKQRPLPIYLLWGGAAAFAIMTVFSQSRGLLFMVAIVFMSAVVAGVLAGRQQLFMKASVWPVLLIVGAALLAPVVFPSVVDTFVTRWNDAWASESQEYSYGIFGRALYSFIAFIGYMPSTPLSGYLLGLGGNAANSLSWVHQPVYAEGGWSRHIVELGPVFGLAFIIYRIYLTIWLGLKAASATLLSADPAPTLLFGYVGIVILSQQITGQGTINGYAWMFFGFCLAAVRLAKESAWRQARRQERAV